MPGCEKLASTLKRSPAKAQRTCRSGRAARENGGDSYGRVDVLGSSKEALYRRARKRGVSGRSKNDKKELARAIARKQ